MAFAPRTLLERFERNIERDPNSGCWLWSRGSTRGRGYGNFGIGGGVFIAAHRMAWELYRGPIPNGDGHHGTCVCHRCDTPACVNPDHLFLGSHQDNMVDMKQKGRKPGRRAGDWIGKRGESHHFARLSQEHIEQIRASAEPRRLLAERFGVSITHIGRIVNGQSWK